MIDFYSYPKCSSCKRAKAWLSEHHVPINEIHLIENPPSAEKLKELQEKSGLPIRRFFNTSGVKYRELQLKDKLEHMTKEEAFQLLASDGKLIKRPIATDGKKLTLGFKVPEYEANWS